jgi:hypothetical protein
MRHFLNSKRPRQAALTAVALVAAALAPVGASAAKHHHVKAKHHRPAGAVKLPKSKVKHVKGVTCGELHKKWVPGSIVGGYFISDSQQAHNYAVLAKHAKGKSKVADTKLSKKFAKRAKARQKTCAAAGGNGGKQGGAPLRFNLAGAVGLALKSGNGASASASHAGHVATASAESTESNLQVVNAAGQVSDAVSSGKAPIGNFLIAPDGKLYVMFEFPVNLETSASAGPGNGCVLAQVNPSSGVPTCIDTSLSHVGVVGDPNVIIDPPVQFDSSGAIYYAGSTNTNEVVLRKWSNGVATDLIPPAKVQLNQWLVLPNGAVLLSGITTGTGTGWLRRVSPSGSLMSLSGTGARVIVPTPDGNAFLGFNGGSPQGVALYQTSTDSMPSKWWIANSAFPGAPETYNDVNTICSGVSFSDPKQGSFCGFTGSLLDWAWSSPEGKEYVLPGCKTCPKAPMEYYPTVSFLPTMVKNASVAEGAGSKLLLAGTEGSGNEILTLFNTSTNNEEQLLGPPVTQDQYEIYHLNYVANGNKVLFDGLRFSDNHYVIGEYDLNTHQVNVVASSTSKWADLQGF